MFVMKKNLAVLAALAAVLGAGCGVGKSSAKPTGSAMLATGAVPGIQSVQLTISAADMSPMVVQLSKNGAGTAWTSSVSGIPAGLARKFHIDAYDQAAPLPSPAPAPKFSGEATENITAGSTANVYIVLQQVTPPNAFGNHAPVIDTLTASASTVNPGTSVTLSVTAHDPDTATDPNNKITGYLWSANCGTFDTTPGTTMGATSQTPKWTAPATDQTCSLNVTVTDTCGTGTPACNSSITAIIPIVVKTSTTGNANVNAYPNTWPVITCIASGQTFDYDPTTHAVTGYQGDVTVIASDVDGDDLKYTYQSVNCPGAVFSAAGTNPALLPTAGAQFPFNPPQPITNTPTIVHFKSNTNSPCDIKVSIADFWSPGTKPTVVPPATPLPDARGGSTTGTLFFGAAQDFKLPPVISATYQGSDVADLSTTGNTITVILGATVSDPNPVPAYPLSIAWAVSGGGTIAPATATAAAAGPITATWTSPTTAFTAATITLTVTNGISQVATKTYTIAASGACSPVCGAGTHCNVVPPPGASACVPNTCTATCSATQHCDTSTNPGTCVDNACTPACTGTQHCDLATSTCVANVCAPACGAGFTCNTAVNPGVCLDNCAGVSCGAGQRCDGTSNPGVCVANNCAAPCAAGQYCNSAIIPAVCAASPVPASKFSRVVPGKSVLGVGEELAGAVYAVGQVGCNITAPATTCDAVAFGAVGTASTTVQVAGGNDAYVAKYDSSGSPVWAIGFGEPAGAAVADQTLVGVGVTSNGTIAVAGSTAGPVVAPGFTTLSALSGNQQFLALINPSGGITFGKAFDLGAGQLTAVAASKNGNRIALCGYTDKNAIDLVPGYAGYVAAAPGNLDVVIALYDVSTPSAPTQVWSKQLGAGSNEICQSIAINDAGDVIAAGQYNTATGQGTFNPGLGAFPAQSNPNWKFLWVAKYSGLAAGTTLAQASFGGTGGNQNAYALDTDASGAIFIGGSFTLTLPFSATLSVTSPSGASGYVAKLDGSSSSLAPVWAVRAGAVVNKAGATSTGDVVIGGNLNAAAVTVGTNYSALNLPTYAGGTDAFLAELSGAADASGNPLTLFQGAYGDASAQNLAALAVNRLGTGTAKNQVAFGGVLSGTINFFPLDPTKALSGLGVAYLGIATIP